MDSPHRNYGNTVGFSHAENDDELLGLSETATSRLAQALRFLTAMKLVDAAADYQFKQREHMVHLTETVTSLNSHLAAIRQELIDEKRKFQTLETIFRHLVGLRRAA